MRIALLALLTAALAAAQVYPNRWVYISRGLSRDSDVDEIRSIAQTSAAHGLNGIMFSTGFDATDRQGEAFLRRLGEVKRIAEANQLELIPIFLSPGYAGSLLAHNRNLAEGLPVRDALYIAGKEEARLSPDPTAAIANGGFEEYTGNTAKKYNFHDSPGVISFIDRDVVHGGAASLRFENFTANQYGHGRVMQEVPVTPYRNYRVTLWVKSENLQPASGFAIQVLTTKSGALAPWSPNLTPTTDGWRKLVFGFNSGANEKVRLYAGVWGGKSGRFWLDDWSIEEAGLVNVLRRDGTPVRVVDEKTGVQYEEGADYARITDPQLNFRFDHDGPPVRIPAGSRIADGTRLRVSFYHAMSINSGQVSACMSEPELLEITRANVRLIQQHLAPKKWMLSIDEIRAGGSCETCKRRGMTMGQILGDFITQAFLIIREANPEADVWAWSDMLDPNHNAHGDYYLVDGDYAGSWDNIPSSLGIVCWYYSKRNQSVPFFAERGFRTIAGAYYDADDLENPKGWMETMRGVPGASGIMYTTWQDKYGLLGEFGDLVSRAPAGAPAQRSRQR